MNKIYIIVGWLSKITTLLDIKVVPRFDNCSFQKIKNLVMIYNHDYHFF
jgi:hypothetical protein